MPTIAELVVRVVADVSGFAAGLSQADTAAANFGTNMAKIGAGLQTAGGIATGIGLAIVGPLTGAVVAAASFEKEMRNVNTVAKLADAEFKALSASILRLSTEVPKSPVELARTMNTIVQAGFQGKEAMDLLRASTIAAVGGMARTEDAANAIAVSLLAYGKAAGGASNVGDILSKTVDAGRVTFSEAARQYGDFVGIGALMGVTLKDLGIAFATLTRTLGPAESATALSALLSGLNKPSKEMVALFKEWGVESGQAAIKQFGLIGVLEKLQTEVGGNAARMNELFGNIRAVRGVSTLLGNDMAQLRDVQAAFGTVAGTAAAKFAEQMRGLNQQLELLKTTGLSLATSIGTILIPPLLSIVQAILPIVQAVATWADANPRLTTAIVLIAAAVSAFLLVLGPVLIALGAIVTILGGLGIGFTAAAAAAGVFSAAVLAGIASLVLTFIAMRDAWNFAVAAFQAGAELIGPIVQRVVTFLQGLVAQAQAFLANIPTLLGSIVARVQEVIAGALTAIQAFFAGLVATVTTFLAGLVDRARAFVAGLPATVQVIIATIQNAITAAFTAVQTFFANLFNAVAEFVAKILARIQPVIDAINFLKNIPGTLLQKGADLLNQIRNPLPPAPAGTSGTSGEVGPSRISNVTIPLQVNEQTLGQVALEFVEGRLVAWMQSVPTG